MKLPDSAKEFEKMIWEANRKTRNTKMLYVDKKQKEQINKLHKRNKRNGKQR